jgi:aryl-alcohol dehydrogenase-like predicted oxidoreductase
MEHRRLGRTGVSVSKDTADVYSAGESEEIVGEALKSRREDVVLATEVYRASSWRARHLHRRLSA